MQDHGARAIGAHRFRRVRCQNKRPIVALYEQLLMRSLLKALIADREDFVHEVAVEIDGKRKGEVQPRPHTGRVRAHRFGQILAELGEVIDVIAH